MGIHSSSEALEKREAVQTTDLWRYAEWKHSLTIAWMVSLGPCLGALWLWNKFAVNAPIMDQWVIPWLLQAAKSWSNLSASLLTAHLEHPTLFPKIMWLVSGYATKFDTRVDAAINIILTIAMFAEIAAMAAPKLDDPLTLFGIFAASVAVFSFVHYDTWLWGFMLVCVLANATSITAIFVATTLKISPVTRLSLAWLLCFVASFSDLGGMVAWLAFLPCTLVLFEKKKSQFVAAVVVVLGLLLSVALYLTLFRRMPYGNDTHFWLKHPYKGFTFFSVLLGAPLSQIVFIKPELLALCIGIVLICILITGSLMAFRLHRFPEAVPWISVSLYGFGFAAVAAIGRSDWGADVASTMSRYMSSTVLATVGTLMLVRLLTRHVPTLLPVFLLQCCMVVVLSVMSSVRLLPSIRRTHAARSSAAAFLEIERYIDKDTDTSAESCLFPLFPFKGDVGHIRQPADVLASLGFRKIASNLQFVSNPDKVYGSVEQPGADGRPLAIASQGKIRVTGWAVLLDQHRIPRIVLLTVGDKQVGITAALVGTTKRPDVARALNNTCYLRSGWSATVPAEFLPKGRSELKAWVYVRKAREFVRLPHPGGPIVVTNTN